MTRLTTHKCTKRRCLSIVKMGGFQPKYCEWRIFGKCGWTKCCKGGALRLDILKNFNKISKVFEVME